MQIKIINEYPAPIAVVHSNEVVIHDVQSALDFMMSVRHETGSDHILFNKSAICEDFFKLSTGIAGEVLQKFVLYHCKFAIIGDFSGYTSKPLHDFIFESNKGNHILFAADEEEAIALLKEKEKW